MPFVGNNSARAGGWIGDTARGYDESKYQYGGYAGGAADERANLAYRQQQAENRTGPQIDQTAQNQTRGIQMGSLASLQDAAAGKGPSAAETLGQQMSDRALNSQVAAAGTVRGGPGAQAAAYRSASQNAMTQRADMNQGIQAQRANEIANARGQLAQASTAARGQDIGLATDQARINQQQTALNDQRAEQYENLQNRVAEDQLQAGLTQQQIGAQSQNNANQLNVNTQQHNADRDFDLFKAATGAAGGVVQGALSVFSDPQSKMPVMGSLASLGLGGTTDVGDSGGMTGSSVNAASTGLGSATMPGSVGGTGFTGGAVKAHGMAVMPSDPREKTSLLHRGYVSGDAEKDVAARRKRGGYANLNADPRSGDSSALTKAIEDDTRDASPYDRSEEGARGVAGAPRGYAASRAGKPGSMFGESPEADASIPGLSKDESGAPGTNDWKRYGESAKTDGDPDWKRGGATRPTEKGQSGWAKILGGGLGGLRDWATPRPAQVAERDTITSDPAAKEEAFQAGVRTGAVAASKQVADDAKSSRNENAAAALKYLPLGLASAPIGAIDAGLGATAGLDALETARARDDAERARIGARQPRKAETSGAKALEITSARLPAGESRPFVIEAEEKTAPRTAETTSPRALDILHGRDADSMARAFLTPDQTLSRMSAPPARKRDTSTSSEDAKDPVPFDYEANKEPSRLRDPQTFRRDTPAKQAQVRKAYLDNVGKQADDLMASMQASLKQGPAVADRDSKQFGDMSDQAMAGAMRSMEASPYAYKPGLRPPGQAPGEVNVGPMADRMAHDPVARTAIVRDPETGLLAIDKDKGLKVVMGSLASLQDQVDRLEDDVPRAVRAKKARRDGSSAEP
jgi:hypothetical protein